MYIIFLRIPVFSIDSILKKYYYSIFKWSIEMKRFFFQSFLLLGLSIIAGVVYNYFQDDPLPLFKSYWPREENPDRLRIFSDDHFISEIDTAMLKSLMKAKQAILLDAGDENQFQKKHIPSAINLPISRFTDYYDRLSPQWEKNQILVTHCIRENCLESFLLARQLLQKGYRDVFIYRGSIEEWDQYQENDKKTD